MTCFLSFKFPSSLKLERSNLASFHMIKKLRMRQIGIDRKIIPKRITIYTSMMFVDSLDDLALLGMHCSAKVLKPSGIPVTNTKNQTAKEMIAFFLRACVFFLAGTFHQMARKRTIAMITRTTDEVSPVV